MGKGLVGCEHRSTVKRKSEALMLWCCHAVGGRGGAADASAQTGHRDYSGSRIIHTKSTRKFCANYPYIEVSGVNEEAYNYVINDFVNYPGCTNLQGSNYLAYTVQPGCVK